MSKWNEQTLLKDEVQMANKCRKQMFGILRPRGNAKLQTTGIPISLHSEWLSLKTKGKTISAKDTENGAFLHRRWERELMQPPEIGTELL